VEKIGAGRVFAVTRKKGIQVEKKRTERWVPQNSRALPSPAGKRKGEQKQNGKKKGKIQAWAEPPRENRWKNVIKKKLEAEKRPNWLEANSQKGWEFGQGEIGGEER